MSKVAQWMEVTASAGVIIGIALLIIELSQNTLATQTEATFSLQKAMSDQVMAVVNNDDLLHTMEKIYDDEELEGTERMRATLYFSSTMGLFSFMHSQLEAGTVNEELIKSFDDDILLFTYRSGYAKWFWQANKDSYNQSFVVYVDALIARQ